MEWKAIWEERIKDMYFSVLVVDIRCSGFDNIEEENGNFIHLQIPN